MTQLPIRAQTPGSATAAVGDVDGIPAVLVRLGEADDPRPLDLTDGETLATAARLARERRLPLVVFVSSTGADITKGVSATHGWGMAAREWVRSSGIVPIIMCVTGPAVSGPALLLGLSDHVIMTDDAYAFVSGPTMVKQFTGVPVAVSDLGGQDVHARTSGAAGFVVPDEPAALGVIAELLSLLPAHTDELPPRVATADPADREVPELRTVLPTTATGSYDMRTVLAAVVDDGALLEPRSEWAKNLVTALGTIDGRPVGMVANQPQSLAGTLDIAASQKGARFVAFCDAFNLPLVTFVDTPGFYPGKDLEWRGMIRKGAQLAFAYARATVPRLCVTLRKSYGGAYIVMDSKHMGNDIAFAWPSAEIAVMGAKGAVEILHRRASEDERAALEADYEDRLLNPYIAAERGSIDAVIDPARTRAALADALEVLDSKRERIRRRFHDNMPL